MNLMTRLVCLLALGFLLLGHAIPASAQDQRPAELRIGMDPGTRPYNYIDDDGDFRGSDAEIANALCAAMRAQCKFVPIPFVQLLTALQEGSIEAIISNMSVTRERAQLVDFTDVYRTVPNRFVARHNAALEISPEGLAGKKIGVRRNSVHDRYATDQYGTTALIRRYSDLAELFVDLALGRNDAVLVEVPAARTSFLQTRLGADYEFVGPELNDERWFGTGIGIAVRNGANARREALNQALATIRADGTYQRIIDRYFNSK